MSLTREQLNQLLNELKTQDSSLNQNEPALVELLNQLSEAEPEAPLNQGFRLALKSQLLDSIRAESKNLDQQQNLVKEFSAEKPKLTMADFFMPRFVGPAVYVLAGLLLGVILARPLFFSPSPAPVQELAERGDFSQETTLESPAVAGQPERADTFAGKVLLTADFYQGNDFSIKEAELPVYQQRPDQTYQSELKPVEQDPLKLLNLAKEKARELGLLQEEPAGQAEGVKEKVFKLGTPQRIYFKQVKQTNGFKEELLPGLSFPILARPLRAPKTPITILVPLTKE